MMSCVIDVAWKDIGHVHVERPNIWWTCTKPPKGKEKKLK